MTLTIETRTSAEITAPELYDLLRLRVEVFVVEQDCPYPDLDGQDLLEDTVHAWAHDGGAVLGCLRVLRTGSQRPAIGRVVTAPAARGRGVAAALVEHAVALCGPGVLIDLHAQAHLEHWYARLGFARAGEPHDEDGIPHVPMTRTCR